MKGMNIAEGAHVVQMLAPVDIDGGASSDVLSMENYHHLTILVMLGVTGGATTITVEECDDFTPTTHPAIAFNIYKEETAGGDTLGARTAVTTAGVALSTNDGVFYVIEIEDSELSDGYPGVRVSLSDPGAATFGSVIGILSGPRYAQEQSATAIA